MNFFEHQDRAKQNTTKLIVFFMLGVLSLIIALSIVVVLALSMVDPNVAQYVHGYGILAVFESELFPIFAGVALGVVGIVGVGALFKAWQLSDGGRSVAEGLGGKLLLPNSSDFYEKRALNVVEEMAIASGIAVPPVYILDEGGINAFAAGYNLEDAVVGLTRGCITSLSRDELQGVVAHEFSHIFHGDMRLNIRIVSWLHGMVLIGMIGRIVMRFSHTSSSKSRGKNSGVPAALAIGVALAIAGYAGSFFGGLIRAALSRQREYLADASAVQYTRNPEGIANALKKIGANSLGASIGAPQASEFSHLFFGDIVTNRFSNLMATHPPLESRIIRIDPSWDGRIEIHTQHSSGTEELTSQSNLEDSGTHAELLFGALAQAGVIMNEHVSKAQSILQQIDKTLYTACHDPFLARVVVYGIIQSKDMHISKKQFLMIEKELTTNLDAQKVFQNLYNVEDPLIIPLLELAMPTLKALSDKQKESFYTTLDAIIKADGSLSLLEWSIRTIVRKNLEQKHPVKAHATLLTCKAHAQVVLSMLAYLSKPKENEAFVKSYDKLHIGTSQLLDSDGLHYGLLEHALMELERLQPKHKEHFLESMITCIGYDGVIKPREIQLFKAIALAIGVVLPPLGGLLNIEK